MTTDQIQTREGAARVFVVDSDPAVLHSFQFAMGVGGFDVTPFPDALALLSGRTRVACDVLVVEHQLPVFTGLDLVEALKKAGEAPLTFVLATNPNAALRRRARAADVKLIEKPILDDALTDAIRASLGAG